MTGSVHLVCDQGSPILWRCRFFLIFKGKIIFHTPYFAFSSILWWTLWSLPPFTYCELTLLWTLVYKHLSRLLSISLEVELLDHMVTLCLIFLKNFYAIFHSGCTVQHPRFECIRASVSLHLCELFFFFFCCFDSSYSNGCEVVSCSIDLHFSSSDVEHLFMCFLAICVCIFPRFGHAMWLVESLFPDLGSNLGPSSECPEF